MSEFLMWNLLEKNDRSRILMESNTNFTVLPFLTFIFLIKYDGSFFLVIAIMKSWNKSSDLCCSDTIVTEFSKWLIEMVQIFWRPVFSVGLSSNRLISTSDRKSVRLLNSVEDLVALLASLKWANGSPVWVVRISQSLKEVSPVNIE